MRVVRDNVQECILAFFKREIDMIKVENFSVYSLLEKARYLVELHKNEIKKTIYYNNNVSINGILVPNSFFNSKNVFLIVYYRDKHKKLLFDKAVELIDIAIRYEFSFLTYYYSNSLENISLLVKLTNIEFDTIYKYQDKYYLKVSDKYEKEMKYIFGEFLLESCSINENVMLEYSEIFIAKKASNILKAYY